MSFREKSAWISLLSMAGIYGVYFWSFRHAGPQARGFHFGGLLGTISALVVVQILLTVGVEMCIRDSPSPVDNRHSRSQWWRGSCQRPGEERSHRRGTQCCCCLSLIHI